MYLTVKNEDIYENFYDMDFKTVNINHRFKRFVPEFDKPECFEKMKDLASKLSKGIPFVRVDFFQINGKVYFGELTFTSAAGRDNDYTDEALLKMGQQIKLDFSKKIKRHWDLTPYKNLVK